MMRRYSVLLLIPCLLFIFINWARANKNDKPEQFLSLKSIEGIKFYSPKQSTATLASCNGNLLYIDSDQDIGWLNERKLNGEDFVSKRNQVLISRKLLSELTQKPLAIKDATKKVYALFHGFRRTRLQDGDLGGWKVFYKTEKSKTGTRYINFNPDLIDKDGHHQVASSDGVPIVGMQSDSDPDYIEYNILLAKSASVDGFIMDYVFPEHSNTVLIKNYINIAKKYSFEVGVDWLDASVYANWIQNYPGYENIKTREQKTEYAKYALSYALQHFYPSETAATFKQRPLFFIFGGATSEELKSILNSQPQISNAKKPIYIRRSQLWGKMDGKDVDWDDIKNYYPKWHNIGVDIFSWKTTCVRPTAENAKYSKWDKYASWKDNFDFVKQYEEMWRSDNKVNVNTACIWPGFDDRACAGWGIGTFSVIDRKEGELYRALWQYYLQHKKMIDIAFIASWSDYTEGHEIAPTVKNGYREILSTLKYANAFKDKHTDQDTGAVYYPERIFRLRKQLRKFEQIGLKLNGCQQLLDFAALAVSRKHNQLAENVLRKVAKRLADARTKIARKTIHLRRDNDFHIIKTNGGAQLNASELKGAFGIVLADRWINLLQEHYYEGFLNFSYYGDDFQTFRVTSATNRPLPHKLGLTQGDYSIIADIRKSESNKWEKCKAALYAENIKFNDQQKNKIGDIRFSGNANIRDIGIDITYYEVRDKD